ncbi:unnamed protein product [Arctogadus glacialis]
MNRIRSQRQQRTVLIAVESSHALLTHSPLPPAAQVPIPSPPAHKPSTPRSLSPAPKPPRSLSPTPQVSIPNPPAPEPTSPLSPSPQVSIPQPPSSLSSALQPEDECINNTSVEDSWV